MFHSVDGVIEVEMEFGDDTQLVSLEGAEFAAELAGVVMDSVHGVCHLVLGEDGEIDMGYRQVRGHTHLADGDKRAGQGAGEAQEDVAQVFLYKTCDFVLSSGLHSSKGLFILAGRGLCAIFPRPLPPPRKRGGGVAKCVKSSLFYLGNDIHVDPVIQD